MSVSNLRKLMKTGGSRDAAPRIAKKIVQGLSINNLLPENGETSTETEKIALDEPQKVRLYLGDVAGFASKD